VVAGVLLFAGYRAAASASLFQLRKVEVQGTARASADAVQMIVRRDVSSTGVWQADLKEISAHLERLLWVRSAVVTRVLPDGIRVRITERVPRAVVRLSTGRFAWVDDDAVLLGEMKPTDEMPPFFLRGWNEDDSETARGENSNRVSKYLELRRLWDGAGLSERVSEVNLIDVRDVRAQLAGDDSQIEVRLGSQDLGKRLKQALEVLDEQRKTARGSFISYVDLTQGKRAIVGFVSGAHAVSDGQPGTGGRRQQQDAATVDRSTEVKERTGNREGKTRQKEKREEASRNRTG
jgi:cell division protein FtsQ